jgi:prepilin-type N-terminal cleavage/methylation domain-containing protein
MKVKKKRSSPKGFTLIEMLIVVGIVAFIMIALLTFYATGQKYFITESARADVLRSSRQALNWLSRDIKEGIEVLDSYDTYTTSDNCLILKIASVDANGLVIDIANDFDYIIYRVNPAFSNRLERIVDANDGVSSRTDVTRVIVDNAGAFVLSSEGTGLGSIADFSLVFSVRIMLTTSQTWIGKTYSETFNTMVKLRNKIGT